MTKPWLPFPRRELVARNRCPECGLHIRTQGHREGCPNREED